MTAICTDTFDTPTRPSMSTGLLDLPNRIRGYLRGLRHRRLARQAYADLHMLQDRLLDDVGLSRHEVERHLDWASRLESVPLSWRMLARLRS